VFVGGWESILFRVGGSGCPGSAAADFICKAPLCAFAVAFGFAMPPWEI